ncbi:MAG: hypothetical protein ACFFDN_10205 [Candidatus Hodarchaeota archaeon]
MNGENNKITKKIWDIREFIQKLEIIKDKTMNYLNSLKKLDNSTRNLWISDIKEFYYNIVSAWEILRESTKIEHKNIENSKSYLYGARNCLSKITSELKIFQNQKSSMLINEAEKSFNECWDAFWLIFKSLLIENETVKPKERVIKISDLEYQLPCSVCSKIAVEFKVGYGRLDKNESLVFRGITIETSLNITLAYEIFSILQRKDLLGFHNFMKKYHSYEGVDAYCPKCDKIYFWEHYNAREEYDDGFYDCTYGECPNGHKRMIDD